MKSFKMGQKYEEHEMVWKIGGSWSGVEKPEEPEKVWKIRIASKGVKNEMCMNRNEKLEEHEAVLNNM